MHGFIKISLTDYEFAVIVKRRDLTHEQVENSTQWYDTSGKVAFVVIFDNATMTRVIWQKNDILSFTVTYHRHGTQFGKWIIPAQESGLVGCYDQGTPFQPASQPLTAIIDQRHVKAFNRAQWADFGLADCLRLELTDVKGNPMGTFVAKANWLD